MSRPQLLQPARIEPQQPREEAHVPRTAPDLLTQGQVCRMLGISDETWRRWRAAGRTPQQVDLPGHPRWRRDDIEALAGQPVAGRYFRSIHRRQCAVRVR